MNWSDEHYVKFYTRETATSRSWPWQTTALWPNLLKHVDGAGILEFGRLKAEQAVSVMTGIPIEVVGPGLKALVEDGTVELRERALIIPNFIEAQEARKSESLKKSDQRERHKAKVRLETIGITHPPVPECPAPSPTVPLQPSPAQPVPVKRAATKPAAPRLKHLTVMLLADYLEVRSEKYKHGGGKDTEALKSLLPLGTDEEIRERWRASLRLGDAWPGCSTFAQLGQRWNDLAAPKGTQKRDPVRADPDAGIMRHREPREGETPQAVVLNPPESYL